MTKQLDSDRPDYTLEGVYKYHLYIAHSLGDGAVAERISDILKRQHVKCYTRHERGTEATNASVIGRIKDGVLCSRKCLVLLTENYIEDDWHKIEIEEVVTKGLRFSPDSVIIAHSGTLDIPDPLKQKAFVVHPYDESNLTDEWVESLAAKALQAPKGTMSVLPRENMGHGSALGYYYGFLGLVLPDFKKRLVEQLFTQHPEMEGKTIKKMLIIIPKSCVCPPALNEAGKIEFANRYVIRMATRAGNVGRDYKSSVYKFFDTTTEHGNQRKETYYFVGELATPLLTMYETYMSGLANMSLDQLYLQREVFAFTLKEILDHPKNRHCNGQFRIVWWCDDAVDGKVLQPLYSFLRPILLEELEKENRESDPSRKLDSDDESTTTLEADYSENIVVSSQKLKTYEIIDTNHGSNPYAYYELMNHDHYHLTHTPRGKCVIINIANFHKSTEVAANALSPRRGAERDAEYMGILFASLSFEVEQHRDVNITNFEQILLTAHLVDHSRYDAFVCVIMTHGKLGVVFASDGLPMRVLDIADFFSDTNCPSLKGKPKMFFIQACQRGVTDNEILPTRMQADGSQSTELQIDGDSDAEFYKRTTEENHVVSSLNEGMSDLRASDSDNNTAAVESNTSLEPPATSESVSSPTSGVSEIPTVSEPSPGSSLIASTKTDSSGAPTLSPSPISASPEQRAALVPGAPDFLMSYSTLPGSISYRDTVAGSLYIQALANNLNRNIEIDRALKNVTLEVKEKLREKRELDRTVYQNQLPFHLTTGMSKLLYLPSKNTQ